MASKRACFGIMLMVFAVLFVACNSSTKISNKNLVGIWELESAQNMSLFKKTEYFKDGTGISYRSTDAASGLHFTWQIRDGNRIQIESGGTGVPAQIVDIELSEKGTLLTYHFDGSTFDGENARKGVYRKK
jgi:hypothetical protein